MHMAEGSAGDEGVGWWGMGGVRGECLKWGCWIGMLGMKEDEGNAENGRIGDWCGTDWEG